jgi:hypothetical protein
MVPMLVLMAFMAVPRRMIFVYLKLAVYDMLYGVSGSFQIFHHLRIQQAHQVSNHLGRRCFHLHHHGQQGFCWTN